MNQQQSVSDGEQRLKTSIEERVKKELLLNRINTNAREITYREQLITGLALRHTERVQEVADEVSILEVAIQEYALKISEQIDHLKNRTHPIVLMLTAAINRLHLEITIRDKESEKEKREYDLKYNKFYQKTQELKAELAMLESQLLPYSLSTPLD